MSRHRHPPRATRLIAGLVALILTFAGLAILGVVALQGGWGRCV